VDNSSFRGHDRKRGGHLDQSEQSHLVKEEFKRAKAYACEYQGGTPVAHFFNMRLSRVSEMLSDFQKGRVLDMGCGPALVGNTFRGRPIEYHGVDISEEMIRECVNRFGDDTQFRFSVASMEELPFPDSHFDVVLCLGALEYVLDARAAIAEISRVARPGAIIIVTMLNARSPYRAWQRFVYWKLKNATLRLLRLARQREASRRQAGRGEAAKKSPTVRLYAENALRGLLEDKGLAVTDTVYYDFNLFLSPAETWFPVASVSLSRKLEHLCRSRVKFLGTGFILKGEKIG
jgi:ubiquinone/menaquinone biosynthesis C-methylase UbiE